MPLHRRHFLKKGSAAALAPWLRRPAFADDKRSPITNGWGQVALKRLDLDEVRIFEGKPGAGYNHHQQILYDRSRLYASWSDGIVNEDNPGQHMVLSTSDDDGVTWSSVSTVTPASPEPTSVFTAMGIRSWKNELVAYYGHYAYTELVANPGDKPLTHFSTDYRESPDKWTHRDIFTEARVSKDRGATWGKPIRIIPKFVPNLRPFPVRSGRLIITGNIAFPYTDDRAGLHGWKFVGIPRLPSWIADDPEGFQKACAFRHDAQNYCEASFYQTVDGIIHMMMRTVAMPNQKHPGLLAVTESKDDGKTWSEPQLTSFTDGNCRFQFGRLPDGRYFGLSCPDPTGPRSPLVLSTSTDGVHFDRNYLLGDTRGLKPRLAGGDKDHGSYGYPSCDIAHGKMYIVYSRTKEDIFFSKLDLKQLV